MSDVTLQRTLQDNGTGAVDALALKQFGGQVFAAFSQEQVTKGRHHVQTISGGKTAQFPVTGRASAYYHTPGAEIKTSHGPKTSSVTIEADGILLSPTYIAEIDKLLTHFDTSSIVSAELGAVLAQQFDKNVLQTMVLAARAAGTVTGMPGGSQIEEANIGTDAAVLKTAFFSAAQIFDEKWVPKKDRNAFLLPAQYYLLSQYADLQNTNYKGNANVATGDIYTVAGINIVETNNLAVVDLSDDTAIEAAGEDPALILAKYRGDFSRTVGVITHKSAVGSLLLKSITTETSWEHRNLSWLLTARIASGHGILRPESAIELGTPAPVGP